MSFAFVAGVSSSDAATPTVRASASVIAAVSAMLNAFVEDAVVLVAIQRLLYQRVEFAADEHSHSTNV